MGKLTLRRYLLVCSPLVESQLLFSLLKDIVYLALGLMLTSRIARPEAIESSSSSSGSSSAK